MTTNEPREFWVRLEKNGTTAYGRTIFLAFDKEKDSAVNCEEIKVIEKSAYLELKKELFFLKNPGESVYRGEE